jgi:hypothetical protein
VLSHGALLIERHGEGIVRRREGVADGVDAGDLDVDATVEEVLHEHHRLVTFLDGLGVEVFGQLRQIVGGELGGNRNVLLRGAEFGADLLLQAAVEFGVVRVDRSHGGQDIAGQSGLLLKEDLS